MSRFYKAALGDMGMFKGFYVGRDAEELDKKIRLDGYRPYGKLILRKLPKREFYNRRVQDEM